MNDLLNTYTVTKFLEVLQKNDSLLLEMMPLSAKALLIHSAMVKLKRPVVVIATSGNENRIYGDLLFFIKKNLYEFPQWEVPYGEEIEPSPDIMGKRLEILHKLRLTKEPVAIVTTPQAVLQKVVSEKIIAQTHLPLRVDSEAGFERTVENIVSLGYERVNLVRDKGEFAVRGGIIDIFPISEPNPYRLEFFGDTIEQIRIFDPMSQKSVELAKNVDLIHANEYQLVQDKQELVPLFDFLQNPIIFFDDIVGIEDKLVHLKKFTNTYPKFFSSVESLLNEKSKKVFFSNANIEDVSANIVVHNGAKKESCNINCDLFGSNTLVTRYFHQTQNYSADFVLDIYPNKLKNQEFSMTAPQILARSKIGRDAAYCEAALCLNNRGDAAGLKSEDAGEEKTDSSTCLGIDAHTTFLYENSKEHDEIKKNVGAKNLDKVEFQSGYLSCGFVLLKDRVAIVPYTEFTKREKLFRNKWRNTYHTPVSEFHELVKGDLVVHFHSGIGKYLGIEKQKNHLGLESEFLVIEYASNGKLFVPISQSHLVSKYIGSKDTLPTLNKLGTSRWQQTKLRAQKAIIGYAKDLLHMHAEREVAGGFAFPIVETEEQEFANTFPYTETKDQLSAISDIHEDMSSTKSMDRLVCGDVGYGKTEVAMRAAFHAVAGGNKQVAVLVPTTVLAMQHFETFTERLEMFPIKVGIVSRFQKKSDIEKTLQEVGAGNIDILIGTHRIISKDVSFKDLGLIIIDEEQRFGVRVKESLKKLKAGVDCITMTATPIPRTMYLSLIHAKDLSVINSPPQDRLPIKTTICEREEQIIKDAILRELSRDGQTYFIHNRIETIYEVHSFISSLVPHARVRIVHGQMSSKLIDEIFHAFKKGEIDILIATTIIENGVDVPNANTIIIDRADKFGISDLYQMRGRVGRWNRSAYAYFFLPKNRTQSEFSQKRLSALAEVSGLGGGMRLAMRDLEIRGAGDILGLQQSGQLSTIGFHLYCKLLKKTIESMKNKEPTSFLETKIEHSYDAKIPEWYVSDPSLRLEIYHRLGEAISTDEVKEIFQELKDRFGTNLPECAKWLYHITALRIFATKHKFLTIKLLSHTLLAEKQLKNGTTSKSLFLTQAKNGEELEKSVVKQLSEAFRL